MNIAEKSMEKTKFYNREDLKAKDVVRLIGIWEGEAAEGMLNDIAVEGICNLVKSLYEKRTIFIITGREGTPEIIEATKKWLDSNSIKVDGLFFRPVKDYSPGAECKKKIYEDNIKGKYNVEFVLDDNYKCVEMWREQGLVCLQPNEGKF